MMMMNKNKPRLKDLGRKYSLSACIETLKIKRINAFDFCSCGAKVLFFF